MSSFEKAMAAFALNERAQIKIRLEELKNYNHHGSQIIENIFAESKLAEEYAREILRDFLDDGIVDLKGVHYVFLFACRRFKLKGELIRWNRPFKLGKAVSETKYRDILVETNMLPNRAAAQALLDEIVDPGIPFEELKDELFGLPLGRYIIWATFNENDGGVSPFSDFRGTADELRDILAIDQEFKGTSLLLMVYEPPDELELFFPTIADAEWYHLFRPTPAGCDRSYGRSQSLLPGVIGWPETVHKVVFGHLLSQRIEKIN